MQKGFATLEIIFVLLIIALLATATIPNAVRVVDQAALDYETKKLYSDLRFLQAVSKSSTFNAQGTGRTNFLVDEKTFLQLNVSNLSWQIKRGAVEVRPEHVTKNIKSIDHNLTLPLNRIFFDSAGQAKNANDSALSGRLILTSQRGKKKFIKFDSVGRFRGGLEDEQD